MLNKFINFIFVAFCFINLNSKYASKNKIFSISFQQKNNTYPNETNNKDLNNSFQNKNFKMIQKQDLKIFKMNNTFYKESEKCEGGCHNGLCLNNTCFCKQGYTGNDCSLTYKGFLDKGFSFKKSVKFFIIIGISSMIFTLLYMIWKNK